MKFRLRHLTTYTYENAVDNYQCILCLQPLNLPFQQINKFDLNIKPYPQKVFERGDFFGNSKHYFSISEPHKVLKVEALSEVEVLTRPVAAFNNISCRSAINLIANDLGLKLELLQYQLPSKFIQTSPEIKDFAESCVQIDQPLYDCVKNLMHKIYQDFQYKSGSTTLNTPLKTVLADKKGVCQDFSHLAIAALRSLGLPAKYVSGYLETLPPPGKQKLVGTDASHAWFAAYIPGMGWCEFDPTNNMIPAERHIVTAYGRDYADIAPLRGIIFSSGKHTVKAVVDVMRLT